MFYREPKRWHLYGTYVAESLDVHNKKYGSLKFKTPVHLCVGVTWSM